MSWILAVATAKPVARAAIGKLLKRLACTHRVGSQSFFFFFAALISLVRAIHKSNDRRLDSLQNSVIGVVVMYISKVLALFGDAGWLQALLDIGSV